ncbi:MAG: hypothetical protein NT092_11980, partial [Bacteroidia bacterium]|nr:hypothetical protein [Bacteroidia bacterium]
CGYPMQCISHGNAKLHGRTTFQCSKSVKGLNCDKTKVLYELVESAVLSYCSGLDVSDIIPHAEQTASELSVLQHESGARNGEISEIDRQLEGILDSKRIGKSEAYLKALEQRYASLDVLRNKAITQREAIQNRIAELSGNGQQTAEQLRSIRELIEGMKQMPEQDRIALRLNLRTQLRRLIRTIRINTTSQRISIFFHSGQRRSVNLRTSEIIMDAYPKRTFKGSRPK